MDDKEYKKLREDIINRALFIIKKINEMDAKASTGMKFYEEIKHEASYNDILQIAQIMILLDIRERLKNK